MSYVAEQITQQEQEQAERELALWIACNAVREGVRRGDPEAIELMNELQKDKA